MTTKTISDISAAYDLACDALLLRALDIANRLVGPTRVRTLSPTGSSTLSTGEIAVMFGDAEHRLGLAGPGLVELRIEPAPMVRGATPRLRCSPRAYSLGSDASLDSCEAQGAALVAAAQFGRALLALLA